MKYKVEVDVRPDGRTWIEAWRYPTGTLRGELMDVQELTAPKAAVKDPAHAVWAMRKGVPGSRTTLHTIASIALEKAMEKDREPLEVVDYSKEAA